MWSLPSGSRTGCGVDDPRVSGPCGGPVDGRIAVDVDPLGWVPPSTVDCADPRASARWVTRAWLTGVAALAVLILGGPAADAVGRTRPRNGQAIRS